MQREMVDLIRAQMSLEQHDDKSPVRSDSMLANAARSLAYSGVQVPLEGITQLAGKIAGIEDAPRPNIVRPPYEAEFGTRQWHAQQIGGAMGVALDFVVLNKLARCAGGSKLSRQLSRQSAALVPAQILPGGRHAHIGAAAVSGGVYEGIFRPVDESEGSFAAARLRHAAEGSLTFAALSGSSRVLRNTALANVGNKPLRSLVASEVTTTALAAAPIGAARAQLSSLLDGNGFASGSETFQQAYQFSLVGASIGGLHTIGRRSGALLGTSRNRLQERDLNILIVEDARAFRVPIEKEIKANGIGKITRLSGVERIGPKPDHILGIKPGDKAEPFTDSFDGSRTRLTSIKPKDYDVALVDGDFIGSLRSGSRLVPELKIDGVPLVIAISGGGAGNPPLLRSGADLGVPKELVKPLIHEGKLNLRDLVQNPDNIPRAAKELPGEVQRLRDRMRSGEDFGSMEM